MTIDEDDVWTIFFVGGTVLAFAFMGCMMVDSATRTQFTERVELISLNDGSRVHGSFFLGSGSIDEGPVFVCYIQQPDGGYKLGTFDAERSTIYMDSEQAYLLDYCWVGGFVLHNKVCGVRYDFHVPKNTIVQQYVLDGDLK